MRQAIKTTYYYNDIYEFVEELTDLNIISTEASNIIRKKLSDAFNTNFGNKRKDYKAYKKVKFDIKLKRVEKIVSKYEDAELPDASDEELNNFIKETFE
ncbi:MAG: hypothetical protein V3V16_14295 [Melioribacteraceae bacterium]